eukprot:scaffold2107_cov192-Alexandrium_tamarense.AAC.2
MTRKGGAFCTADKLIGKRHFSVSKRLSKCPSSQNSRNEGQTMTFHLPLPPLATPETNTDHVTPYHPRRRRARGDGYCFCAFFYFVKKW